MSFRWRIVAALGLLAAVVTVAVALSSYLSTADELAAALDASLTAQTSEVGRGPGHSGPNTVDDNGCPPDALLRPASAAQLVTDAGTVVSCLPGSPALPVPQARPAPGGVTLSTVEVAGVEYRVAATPFHAGGVLHVAQSLEGIDDVLAGLRTRLAAVAVVATGAAAVAGWVLAHQLVRPLVALRDTTTVLAERIRRHEPLDPPRPHTAPREIHEVGASVATLVDALETSREQQRRLVADAGHEIRTPLASLRANLDLLDRYEELAPRTRPEVLRAMRADVDELTELMTQLVELASDPTRDEPVVDVDLADLAEGVAARIQRRTGRRTLVVHDGHGTVPGRPAMLERAIANLVDNAQKYSAPAEPIEVHTTPNSVVVIDRGPGIAAPDRHRMFERFWRADSVRNQPGSGLGLAIVRQIVTRHDGEILVESEPGQGSRIGFRLPAPDA